MYFNLSENNYIQWKISCNLSPVPSYEVNFSDQTHKVKIHTHTHVCMYMYIYSYIIYEYIKYVI